MSNELTTNPALHSVPGSVEQTGKTNVNVTNQEGGIVNINYNIQNSIIANSAEQLMAIQSGEKTEETLSDIIAEAVKANKISTPKGAETKAVELPCEQSSGELPYSAEDQMLLREFTNDYDEIMLKLIGGNYSESLINMTMPARIQELYKSKWSERADEFSDPALKSNIFSLLGELNSISNSFYTGGAAAFPLKKARTKIRNLYVKLHPESFEAAFPYDVFIDDWEDGEY